MKMRLVVEVDLDIVEKYSQGVFEDFSCFIRDMLLNVPLNMDPQPNRFAVLLVENSDIIDTSSDDLLIFADKADESATIVKPYGIYGDKMWSPNGGLSGEIIGQVLPDTLKELGVDFDKDVLAFLKTLVEGN